MISCKCITHGRVHLLEEALHSFLLQDNLEDTELVIVNDYYGQNLIFDHPNVKIFNFKEYFKTIGEKENFALEQCKGDIFVVWDDDDIALPNHLNNIRKYFVTGSNILHWQRAVYYNEPNISTLSGVGNSGIVYSKKAWLDIGKSPIMNAGGDMELVKAIHALDLSKVVNAAPSDEEISWFYRWSLPMNYHQSGQGYDKLGNPDIVVRNHTYVESLRMSDKIPVGNINLKPHWRHDYKKMLENYINNENTS